MLEVLILHLFISLLGAAPSRVGCQVKPKLQIS